MGQKKTWSFHHVPFSMLWETLPMDYHNNWNSIKKLVIVNNYSKAVNNKNFQESSFFYKWKNKYVVSKTRATESEDLKKKQPLIKFSWIENANKGSNESSCNKSYFLQIDGQFIIINFFFRQSINFREKLKNKKNRLSNPNFKIKNYVDITANKKVRKKWKLIINKSKRNSNKIVKLYMTKKKNKIKNKTINKFKQKGKKIPNVDIGFKAEKETTKSFVIRQNISKVLHYI